MEDVSELFKRHFNILHKGTALPKTVKDRKEDLNNARKAKRDTLAYLRRNISENMSPINTPTPAKSSQQKNKKTDKTNSNLQERNDHTISKSKPEGVCKRLERLQEWKAAKTKLKEQEKAKAKPIFKVHHISTDSRVDIENANKLIKGKPFVPGSATKKSQFAPPNHKFNPPKGIKPLVFNRSIAQTQPNLPSTSSTLTKLKCSPRKAKTNPVEHSSSSLKGNSKDKGYTKSNNKIDISKPSTTKFTKIIKDSGDGLLEEANKKIVGTSHNTKTSKNIKPKPEIKKTGTSNTAPKKLTPAPSMRVTRNNAKALAEKNAQAKESSKKTPKKTKGLKNNQRELQTSKLNKCVDIVALVDKTDKGSPKIILSKTDVIAQEKVLTSDVGTHSTQSVELHNAAASSSSISTDYSVNYSGCSPTVGSTDSLFESKISPPVYVSPFVTISRGKNFARMEHKIRTSEGKCEFDASTPEVKKILSAHISPKAGALYFTRKLDTEVKRITEICNIWETYLEQPDLPEEALSSIGVAVGQSKLLLTKKFQQFRGLISQCETENYEVKPVTCKDLHGFWDMVYMQVGDLDNRFAKLQKLKDSNWEEVLPQKVVPLKRSRGRPKKAQTKSKLHQLIQEAKKNKQKQHSDTVVLINGLDYQKDLHTPAKEKYLQEPGSATRKSGRLSVVKSKSRCSSSPGLTMMKISQSIKQGDGLTPARSILKSDVYKSAGKKSVVFKEDLEVGVKPLCKANLFHEADKENISDNFISFSPLTPRRSTRLSKLNM